MKRIVGAATLAVLAACGGGGGGDGAGAPPPPPTGISEAYYPVGVGMKWVYGVDDYDPATPASMETMITGTRTVSGMDAWVFADSVSATGQVIGEEWYAKDARAYTFLGGSGTASGLNSALAPFEMMRFDGTFSATPLLVRSDVDIGMDADGDGINDKADLRIDGTVEGTETLSTDLGTFSNTARVRYDITGTIKLSRGYTVPISETVRSWHAPQVGALRQSLEMKVGTAITKQGLEATGFAVGSILAGVVPLQDVVANLAAANSDETRPGYPALATDGQRYFLVTNREGASGRQWIGQFIDADARLQGSVTLSPETDIWDMPALAWNGSNYLVVTNSVASGMRVQRTTAEGLVLDAYPGTQVAADGFSPQVAAGNGSWLVVYRRQAARDTLFGKFISATGVPGPEFVIAGGLVDYAHPAVAFDGTNYLVAWESGLVSNPAGIDVYARRVGPSGTLLDAAPFAVSVAPESQTYPRIACDPVNCLVTWVDRRGYSGPYAVAAGPGDIYGALVTRAGTVLAGSDPRGGTQYGMASANAGYPGLAFDGSQYIVAWSSGVYQNVPGGPTGIYAAKVGTDGALNVWGAPISGEPPAATRYLAPALASVQGRTLAVWLSNSEMSGTSKSMKATIMAPKVTR